MPRPPQRRTEKQLKAEVKASADIFVARRKSEPTRREQAITMEALALARDAEKAASRLSIAQ